MATFKTADLIPLELSIKDAAELSDEERDAILQAGAEIVQAAQKQAIATKLKRRTGQLYDSIDIWYKGNGADRKAVIGPTGKRVKGYTGKRKSKGKGNYLGTNAEVLFVLEYGSRRVKARHLIEDATKAAEPELSAAMQKAWDDHLARKGL